MPATFELITFRSSLPTTMAELNDIFQAQKVIFPGYITVQLIPPHSFG